MAERQMDEEEAQDERISDDSGQLLFHIRGNRTTDLRGTTFSGADDVKEEDHEKFILERRAGTFHGVFIQKLPFVFGLTIFETIAPTIGQAGTVQGFFIILICTLVGLLSACSFSAIATNGKLKSGGIYRITKYAFGRPFAASFTLLSAFIAANYVISTTSKLGEYLIRDRKLNYFVDFYGDNAIYVWTITALVSIVLLSFLFQIKYFGVTVSNVLTYTAVISLHASIILFMVGVILRGRKEVFCKSKDGFILNSTMTPPESCDPDMIKEYYHEPFQGIQTDIWFQSTFYVSISENHSQAKYGQANYLSYEKGKIPEYSFKRKTEGTNQSFMKSLSIFFFAITSVFTLANSTNLKHSQISIPRGIISAISYVAITYYIIAYFMILTLDRSLLIDHKLASTGDLPIFLAISYPNPAHTKGFNVPLALFYFILAFQSLNSYRYAVKLVQYWADDIGITWPAFKVMLKVRGFKPMSELITFSFSLIMVGLINNADFDEFITSLSFMFLFYINIICFVKMFWPSVEWRPKFNIVHWSLPLIAAVMALFLQLYTISQNFLLIIVIPFPFLLMIIFECIEGKTTSGDGRFAIARKFTIWGLLQMNEYDVENKEEGENKKLAESDKLFESRNYQPLYLVMLPTVYEKFNLNKTASISRNIEYFVPMLDFCKVTDYLSGLTIITAIYEGKHKDLYRIMAENERKIAKYLSEKLEMTCFLEIGCSENPNSCMTNTILFAGLGSLKPNTILLQFDNLYYNTLEKQQNFVETIKSCQREGLSIILFKNIEHSLIGERFMRPGFVDVFGFSDDNGFGILYAYLLKKSNLWKSQKLRFNIIVPHNAPTEKLLAINSNIRAFLESARIPAEIFVIKIDEAKIEELAKSIRNSIAGKEDENANDFGQIASKIQGHVRSLSAGGDDTNIQLTGIDLNKRHHRRIIKKVWQAMAINNLVKKHIKKYSFPAQPTNLVIMNIPKISGYQDSIFFEYINKLSDGIPNLIFVDSQKAYINMEL